jgi:short-subunit dehydrogenase
MKNPKSILLTGGSSGIGEALLLHYAAPGITLAFNGRNRPRLDEVAAKIRAKGANAYPRLIDVREIDTMRVWINEMDSIAPLDIVFANVGAGPSKNPKMSDLEKVKEVFDINVDGILNTVHPALELMCERDKGQIVILSSLAGYFGYPVSPSYAASKAALKSYGRGLRSKYINTGVEINVVCPGMVHTPMTETYYRRFPGWISVDKAVKTIVKGIERNSGLISFPWHTALLMTILSRIPDRMHDFIWSEYMRKIGNEGLTDGAPGI